MMSPTRHEFWLNARALRDAAREMKDDAGGAGMSDDPRDILKAAGAECEEVDLYMRPDKWEETTYPDHPAILALARLVAKYKWQRDECADDLGRELAVDYEYESTGPFGASDVIVDLNRRWDERGTQ